MGKVPRKVAEYATVIYLWFKALFASNLLASIRDD
ncbi:hypothetical protein VIS19158_15449 [Vibrio scophthalmi LMG 19158]|uniref:Uncharacterized protein n=1 Tax=Vibrio scophthalmi LMG 19158 TaxID=870967 RepID=F9RUV2_9VIBR|nr:hypothetical protein VIS19158_15449 [Vibrio scophthalmi LMG 19158]